jgi:hypothetical protein
MSTALDILIRHNHACRIRKVYGYWEVQTKEPCEAWNRYCGGFKLKSEAQARIDEYRACGWFPEHMMEAL